MDRPPAAGRGAPAGPADEAPQPVTRLPAWIILTTAAVVLAFTDGVDGGDGFVLCLAYGTIAGVMASFFPRRSR